MTALVEATTTDNERARRYVVPNLQSPHCELIAGGGKLRSPIAMKMWHSIKPTLLLAAQRLHRIDRRRPPRRQQARHNSDQQKQACG